MSLLTTLNITLKSTTTNILLFLLVSYDALFLFLFVIAARAPNAQVCVV